VEVELQIVLQQHLQQHIDRKDIFIQLHPAADIFNRISDEFPRRSSGAGRDAVCCEGVLVDLVDEVGPCGADVREGTVVGGVVDEEADVVVTGLVGVLVIELENVLAWSRGGMRGSSSVVACDVSLPRLETGFCRLVVLVRLVAFRR
jgi:hypothetical protein